MAHLQGQRVVWVVDEYVGVAPQGIGEFAIQPSARGGGVAPFARVGDIVQALGGLHAFAQQRLHALVAGRDHHPGAQHMTHDERGVVGQRLVDDPYRIAVIAKKQRLRLFVGGQGCLIIRGNGIAPHIGLRHGGLLGCRPATGSDDVSTDAAQRQRATALVRLYR
ncbi:hypothetical protein D3C86_681260 [compost metagenome]